MRFIKNFDEELEIVAVRVTAYTCTINQTEHKPQIIHNGSNTSTIGL